jgi:hypothetical protein
MSTIFQKKMLHFVNNVHRKKEPPEADASGVPKYGRNYFS